MKQKKLKQLYSLKVTDEFIHQIYIDRLRQPQASWLLEHAYMWLHCVDWTNKVLLIFFLPIIVIVQLSYCTCTRSLGFGRPVSRNVMLQIYLEQKHDACWEKLLADRCMHGHVRSSAPAAYNRSHIYTCMCHVCSSAATAYVRSSDLTLVRRCANGSAVLQNSGPVASTAGVCPYLE